jgi:hypothetical protein
MDTYRSVLCKNHVTLFFFNWSEDVYCPNNSCKIEMSKYCFFVNKNNVSLLVYLRYTKNPCIALLKIIYF